jgi:hypothetical protein
MAAEKFIGPVSPKWLERGTWLSKAGDEINKGDVADLRDLRARLAEEFESLSDGLSAETFLVGSRIWGQARGTDLIERLIEPQRRSVWKRYCNIRSTIELFILSGRANNLFHIESLRPSQRP